MQIDLHFSHLRTLYHMRNSSGKSPKNFQFSGLAGAFSYSPANYIMQAFIVGWTICSLLPARTLYHVYVRVFAHMKFRRNS